jgi:hypothetical protein
MVTMTNTGGYDEDGCDGLDYYSAGNYNSNDGYNQQQQSPSQQHYYDEDTTQQYHPQYYYQGDPAEDAAVYYNPEYYEENAVGAVIDPQQQHLDNYYYDSGENHHHPASSLFHPIRAPVVVHPNGTQDDYGNYDTRGDAISAIAVSTFDNNNDTNNPADVDENNDVSSLIYVASHSTYQGGGGSEQLRGVRGGRSTTTKSNITLHRGSRLTVLYEKHLANDNTALDPDNTNLNPIMYSSFVGHPEANSHVLDGLHSVLFGSGIDIVASSSQPMPSAVAYSSSTTTTSVTMKARPSHAFGPPVGPPSYVHNQLLSNRIVVGGGGIISQRPEERHTMGISSIFEVSTPYYGSGGRICSISPYGVRIHTRGGMIMSDSSKQQQQQHGMLLSGMTCGALMEINPHQHFAVVGGMSPCDEDGGVGGNTVITRSSRQHVHCVDLHRDLKIISSHSLIPDNIHVDNRGQQKRLCVSDMAFHAERNSIVVGCSDGTIRVLDGGRRNVEVAKAKAQMGGVAKVAVWEVRIVV